MLRLHAVQAGVGDCFILEYGSEQSPRYMLIDGGPPKIYDSYLKPQLEKIRDRGGRLNLVVLSHVDSDHVVGLVQLFKDLDSQRQDGKQQTIQIDGIWHNSFSGTDMDGKTRKDLKSLFSADPAPASVMTEAGMEMLSIRQGNDLALLAGHLGIPVNKEFGGRSIIVDGRAQPVMFGSLKITVIGPTVKNLEGLRKEWEDWLDKKKGEMSKPATAASSDTSVPNLSSIMLMAESDGKRMLLTGDGRGDHILQGLEQAGLLEDGKIHVDVLKVPHHGSERNTTQQFFEAVTASEYVISADDGKDNNPDLATLKNIIDAAKKRKEQITIHVTNHTVAVKKIKDDYPPDEYGYRMNIMEDKDRPLVV